jgi:hypothetical protein
MDSVAKTLVVSLLAMLPKAEEVFAAETESPSANGKRPPMTAIDPPEQDFYRSGLQRAVGRLR